MSLASIPHLLPPNGASLRNVRRNGHGFAVAEEAQAEGCAEKASSAPVGSVGLLTLQVEAAGGEHARTQRAVADEALDDLGRLQLALLRNQACSPEELEQLARRAEELTGRGAAAGALGRSIALRVRVELARRAPERPIP